jgi:hypothetical protein
MIARMIRRTTAFPILVSIVAAALLTATAPARGALAHEGSQDVTALFDRALAKVHAQPDFAKAVMLEADGTPAGDRAVNSASKIVRWRFVLDNQGTHGSPFASATISYRRSSGFGSVIGNPSPFLDDLPIKKAPRMTLRRAVSLLEDAGFKDGFVNVTLRDPLGPKQTPPLYIFGLADNNFVGVNTKTGRVAPLS